MDADGVAGPAHHREDWNHCQSAEGGRLTGLKRTILTLRTARPDVRIQPLQVLEDVLQCPRHSRLERPVLRALGGLHNAEEFVMLMGVAWPCPWPALVLKLGSVVEETDDEEEPVQRTTDIGILKEQRAGLPVAEIYRCHGISDETFYTWRSRFGGMEVSDAGRLKSLDEENRKLKKLLAEAMLDVAALREALGKTSDARRTENGRKLGHRGEGLFPASRLRADRVGPEDVPLRLDAG
ncbi:hypothetical protein GCM10025880_35570 [Methylorubrum aminovorans]|nr:hypothetical protein GCM10025880_35570 [Methylorubrum aminovorans]